MIFKAYVLEEDIPKPEIPPYYDVELFSHVKCAKSSGHNLEDMSIKDWYQFLLLQEYGDEHEPDSFRKTKIEIEKTDIEWDLVWKNTRLCSLESEVISFCWKLAHNLLTCESRMASILSNTSPTCKFSYNIDGTLPHIFFECKHSQQVGAWLLNLTSLIDPDLTALALRLKTSTLLGSAYKSSISFGKTD